MPKYSITPMIATAISEMEGFTKPGTLAVVNHNPGNIRTWLGFGRDVLNHGYVVFPSEAEGWRALYKVVDDYIDGRYNGYPPNLEQMFATYAPAADSNDPDHYAKFVASRTGLNLTIPLKTQAEGGGGNTPPIPAIPAPTVPGLTQPEPAPETPTEITDETIQDALPAIILGAVFLIAVIVLGARS